MVEDAHWIDEASADVLRYVSAVLRKTGVRSRRELREPQQTGAEG